MERARFQRQKPRSSQLIRILKKHFRFLGNLLVLFSNHVVFKSPGMGLTISTQLILFNRAVVHAHVRSQVGVPLKWDKVPHESLGNRWKQHFCENWYVLYAASWWKGFGSVFGTENMGRQSTQKQITFLGNFLLLGVSGIVPRPALSGALSHGWRQPEVFG